MKKNAESIIEMKNIQKLFPGTIANDNVSIKIFRGEVLSLLGENGAGKTTLMKILYGMYQADRGKIFIENKPVTINSPQDAMSMGIGMIHQHFTLVPVHTVLENIMLNLNQTYKPNEIAKQIYKLGEQYSLEVDPYSIVRSLPVGIQQRVEILKALIRKTKVLIMDEPTSVLTLQETEKLFNFVKEFREKGNSVIFITHKLKEVMEVADRITVLRNGKMINSIRKKEASEKKLANMMIGQELKMTEAEPSQDYGNKLLEVKNINVTGERGNDVIKDISLNIHRGEILGIAGVSGNGQEELAEVLTGLRKVKSGEIKIDGKNIKNEDALNFMKKGVGYIPADRHKEGLVLDMSINENLVLKNVSTDVFSNKGIIKKTKIKKYAQEKVSNFSIKTPSINTKARALSGGNQQKIVIAREILIGKKLLVAVQPTRGLDIGAANYVRKVLIKERDKGKAILLISNELSEIMSLSDRVSVIYQGSILKTFNRDNANLEEIGLLMTGVKEKNGD